MSEDTASDDSWDDYADGWDDDPAARSYAEAAFGSLVAALDERGIELAGAAVCDFGCGTGLLTERLVDAVASIDAVDSSPAMLEVLAAKVAKHRWSSVNLLSELPTSHQSHDLIVCSSVCGFLDDYPGTVRRLATMLRPGGLFVQWDWERDDSDEDPHGLTRDEIREAITGSGLSDVHVDTGFEAEAYGQVMRPLIGIGRLAVA